MMRVWLPKSWHAALAAIKDFVLTIPDEACRCGEMADAQDLKFCRERFQEVLPGFNRNSVLPVAIGTKRVF